MHYLIIVQGPDEATQEFILPPGETLIGRDPSNSLILDGRGVSRKHAKLILDREKLILVDLGSTYGTRVNDMLIMRHHIKSGDQILIGMYMIEVHEVVKPGAHVRMLDNRPPIAQPAYFSIEDTASIPLREVKPPQPQGDVYQRKTMQFNKAAINFVLDNPGDQGPAVRVVRRPDSDLIEALNRFNDKTPTANFANQQPTAAPPGADYQALLLMYKVSELLSRSDDLASFVEPVADLVREEVKADTVVILLRQPNGEMVPQVIRHIDELSEGEIPVSKAIIDRVAHEQAMVVSDDLSQDNQIGQNQSVMLYRIHSLMAIPLVVRSQLYGILYMSRAFTRPFTTADQELVNALGSLVASGLEHAVLKEHITVEKQQRKSLERFFPPHVVEYMCKTEHQQDESPLSEHSATVLVCDLNGFNQLHGKVAPRKLATVLQDYYELLYDKIFANGGSVVKLHDGWAMALFGTPQAPDHETVWALQTAIELCREFRSLVVMWPDGADLSFRCSLDSGQVTSGVINAASRPEYTALGAPISVAAAIVAQERGTGVWLTSRTLSQLPKNRYRVEAADTIFGEPVFRIK